MNIKSRKHKLYMENGNVVKSFDNNINYDKEFSILTKCHINGLKVPKIIDTFDHTIIMEYLEGRTYSEIIGDISEEQEVALFDWIKHYHQIMKSPRCDMNLGNFIWTDNGCYGIDFADPLEYENIEHDIGSLLAFVLMHDNYDINKRISICNSALSYFTNNQYSLDKIEDGYFAELKQIVYRKKKYWNIDFDTNNLEEAWKKLI